MKYSIIKLRGTGEALGNPGNFLTQFSDALIKTAPDHFTDGGDIPYPSSIGPMNPENNPLGGSLQNSRELGEVQLLEHLRKSPGPFVLMGYSLGAIVTTVTIERLINHREYETLGKIAATVNWANPLRNQGDSFFERDVPGYGIAGQHNRFPEGILYYEIANRFDAICCCPADSPLRTLPDVGDAFSFAVTGGWSADLLNRISTRRWQLANYEWWKNPRRYLARYAEAIALLRGYLYDGQHTSAYAGGIYYETLIKELVLKLY